MKKVFRMTALLVVMSMLIQYVAIQAADVTLTPVAYAFVTAQSPGGVSTGSTYTLTPYEINPSAAYYSFNIGNLSIPEGKYIESAKIKLNLYKNTEYTNGDLIVYSCEGGFASNSLTYATAPETGNVIGKKSNLNLSAAKIDRIDITPAVAEGVCEGKGSISFGIFNYGPGDCKMKVAGIEITYTDAHGGLNVGKAKFYKNNMSEKNCVFNGTLSPEMWVSFPVAGRGEGEQLNIKVASYDENGAVTEISEFEKKVYSGSEESFISFPFSHTNKSSYTRAFIWDSRMSPYAVSSYLTEKSVAELKGVSVSDGKLAPAFRRDFYEYTILFDEIPEAFPEISIQYDSSMKVKRIPAADANDVYTIEVTSADYNKTVKYSFVCKEKETAVISSRKAETEKETFRLPCEESVSVNEGAAFIFDKDYIFGEKSAVSGATLSMWIKASSDGALEIYENSSCEKPISTVKLAASDDFIRYDIPVRSENFTNINSIALYVKGKAEIWSGENYVESSNGRRIPYLTVDYGRTEAEKENTLFWDDRVKEVSGYYEYDMLPYDKYLSSQNPPTFVWPYVDFADSYQFIVAKDEKLKNVVAYRNGITLNLQTFPFELEPGNYYWSVRALKGEEFTEWTDVRRVTVLADATSLPVPEVSYIIDALGSAGHPRILTTAESIEEFRDNRQRGTGDVASSILSDANAAVKKPTMYEPTYTGSNLSAFSSNVKTIIGQIENCSYAYLITGEEKYATTAVKVLKHVAGWKLDAEGGGTSYKTDSQLYRAVLYALVIGYDSVWNFLTDSEKALVEKAIESRMNYLEHPADGLQDAAYRLEYTSSISHGWSGSEAILASAAALAGHSESADVILKNYLPRYLAMNASQTGYQDGGNSVGFAYSSYDSESYIVRTLRNLGIYDMNKSAQYRNSWKNFFYTVFNLTAMEFGDGSYGWGATYAAAKLMRLYARFSKSPYAVWKYNFIKMPLENEIEAYFVGEESPEIIPERPVKLPKSYAFRDCGYVAMHSDLESEDKVSLYFRSSPYGSAAHAHADHNSFHIQAFGERLAIDSGYYDTVSTDHSVKYKRETYAHNAITHSGGKGQANKTLKAKGKITNFITGEYFDLTSGDATEPYNYYTKSNHAYADKQLDKAIRHIIYVRPDYFIVIDDLKAADNKETTFEWWLNAYEDINFTDGKNGAIIRKNEALLEAEIVYPENVTKGGKSTGFEDINGNVWNAEGAESYLQKHQRVWFVTPSVNETSIVSVINVRERKDEEKEYKTEKYSDFVKISFADGTAAYIRTNSSVNEIDAGDGIKFSGAAFVIKNNEFMLVDGTKASVNGKTVVLSDGTVSVMKCKNTVGLSGNSDASVSIATEKVNRISDDRGNAIGKNTETLGVTAEYKDGNLNIDMLSGFYSLKLVTSKSESGIPLTGY